MTVPSLPEQRQLTVARVRDHYARTGALPGELVRHIQIEALRRGVYLTAEQAIDRFETYLEAWAEEFLREADNRSASERRNAMRRRANQIARQRAARHTQE